MKTAVILCTCSGIISERIDWDEVQLRLAEHPTHPIFRVDQLSCGVDHLEKLALWLKKEQPDRLVVAACSPRDHETTFRKLMASAGLNPYLMQLVNVREHVAWVTADPVQATQKATRLLSAALYRVQQHVALHERLVQVCTDVAVSGAGPAGMQAALVLARAGRKVILSVRPVSLSVRSKGRLILTMRRMRRTSTWVPSSWQPVLSKNKAFQRCLPIRQMFIPPTPLSACWQ